MPTYAGLVITIGLLLAAPSIAGVPSGFISRGPGGGGALFSPSFSPHSGDGLYVACDMSELFHSTDAGRSWRTVDFREAQGNRPCRVQYTSNPLELYTIDCTSIDGGDTRRPSRSTDGGSTWTPLATDPTSMDAYTLFTDPNSTNRILVSDYATIYFSTNGGQSFSAKFNSNVNGEGCWIAGAFFDGPSIYVGTSVGLLISTNNGHTFIFYSLPGIPTSQEMASFTGAREGGTTRLLCITVTNNFMSPGMLIEDTYYESPPAYRSIYSFDLGATSWVARTTGITAGHRPLFVDMAHSNISVAYIAGQTADDFPAVYKTTNGAVSWQSVFNYSGNQNIGTGWCGTQGDRDYSYDAYYVGFDVSGNNPDKAAITGYGFVHVTTNGGASWRQAYVSAEDENPAGANTPKNKSYQSIGLENTTCWWLTWADSNTIMACYSDIRGVRSTNAGASWSFNYSGQSYNSLYSAARHPNGTLYGAVGSQHDLYQSTTLQDSSIDSRTGEVLFSTNKGLAWTRLRNFTNMVFHVALDPNFTSRLYAAVVHSTKGGFYVSSNIHLGAASTWTRLANPPRTEGHPFMLRVLNDGALVCTYSGRRTAGGVFTASSGVFLSTDGGASWVDRSHTNMHYWTKDIVIDPFDPGQSNWYVGVFSGWGGAPNGKGGLYRTTNRGVSWTRISALDRVTSCTFHPVRSNELFMTTEMDGLWYSENPRAGSPTFSAVLSYPFRQPERVFFNPYDSEQIWVTSFGHGMRVGRTMTTQPELDSIAPITWPAEAGATYSLHRSFQSLENFTCIASNLWNFSGTLTVTDSTDAASAFYRVTSP